MAKLCPNDFLGCWVFFHLAKVQFAGITVQRCPAKMQATAFKGRVKTYMWDVVSSIPLLPAPNPLPTL